MEGFFVSPVKGHCVLPRMCGFPMFFREPSQAHLSHFTQKMVPFSSVFKGDGTATVISGFVGSGRISWSFHRPEKDHTIHGLLRGPGGTADKRGRRVGRFCLEKIATLI